MPDQKMVTQQEAVGLGAYGGGWSVGTVLDISSITQRHFTVDRDTNVLHIHTDSDVYILFDTAATTGNSTANDLIIPAGLHSISIPRGLYLGEVDGAQNKNVIYMHVLQVTSNASKKLRVVEA